MADWNLPLASTLYVDVLAYLRARDVDAVTLNFSTATNLPEHAMKYERALNLFQEWLGGVWVNKVISIAGGGTGATNPNDIRLNLGLGTMALQPASNVAITGGTLNGVAITNSTGQFSTLSANNAQFGSLGNTPLNASFLMGGPAPPASLGAGVADAYSLLHGNQTWSNLLERFEGKAYYETTNVITPVTGVLTVDLNLGNNFLVNLNQNITSIIISNPAPNLKSHAFIMEFLQDPTGNRTVTGWPASVTFGAGVSAPVITPTANRSDFITLLTRNVGASYRAFVIGQDFP